MMIIVNRYEDYISGALNGEPFSVTFSQERYDTMIDLRNKSQQVETVADMMAIIEEFKPLTQESYKELVETATPFLVVNKASEKYYLKFPNGQVDNKWVPGALVERIIKSVEKNISITPLIKAWVRFRRNPNFSQDKARRFANYINKTYTNYELVAKLEEQGVSRNEAIKRATGYQTPITEEGLLNTYKVSRELTKKWVLDAEGNKKQVDRYEKEVDENTGIITYKEPDHAEERVFEPAVMGSRHDAFYCGDKLGHIIKVGQRHRLESWDQVNCNDNESCVKGLHAGNIDYIKGYQGEDTVTHNVFVDPMYIGAITDDGTGALRLLDFFAHSTLRHVNRGIYHSSTYAAITDAEFEKMLTEIQQNLDKETEDITKRNKEDRDIAEALGTF